MAISSPRDANRIPALIGVSNSDQVTPVQVWTDPTTHRMLVDANVSSATVSGAKSNNSVPPGSTNLGVLNSIANAAAPTWTEGNQVGLSVDLSGNLRTSTTIAANSSVNVNQIAGTAASTGNGTSNAGNLRVNIASDNTAFPVNATLSAETTKVIGTINVAAGQSIGVTQATASNLNAQVQGAGASGAAKAGNPVQIGGVFNTTQPTVTTGQAVELQSTARGAVIVATGADVLNTTINAPLPAGTNVIGALSANQSTNMAQVAGTATDTNSGLKSAGTLRVVLATDQPALTNKLLVTPDALPANQSVNVSQINAVVPLMGNGVTGTGSQRVTLASDNSAVAGLGAGATAAAVPANAIYSGLVAKTANPTAATDGNLTGAMADKLGRQVVVVGNVRDNKANQFTTITSSVAETTVVTAVAATFLDVYGCIVENTSATGTKVTFKDSTAGTTQFEIYVPATETRGFMLPSSDAFKQTTVNTNWTATCGTSVASVVISMLYVKNI